jgi:WD40-like Beta Propeller Repeat
MRSFLTILSLVAALRTGQVSVAEGLEGELRRLGVLTALVLPSSALDDSPLWSPDGRYVAGNVAGTWEKVDLAHLTLEPAHWRGGQRIGVVTSRGYATPLEVGLVEVWRSEVSSAASKNESAAIGVEFRREELSTALVLTRRGQAPKTLWKSDLENCGAPVFSPDRSYVAFICETKGLFVVLVR